MGGLPANRTVNGFAVDPQNSKVMYVAMRDGLFKSVDAGKTWNQMGKQLKNLAAITVNPKKTNELYTATLDGVLSKSVNGGVTWERQD